MEPRGLTPSCSGRHDYSFTEGLFCIGVSKIQRKHDIVLGDTFLCLFLVPVVVGQILPQF